MKTIQVLHTAFHHHTDLASAPLAQRTFTWDTIQTSPDEEILDAIFAVTNGCPNDEEVLKLTNKSGRCYSTSVGDVIVIQDGPEPTDIRYYIVAGLGFKKLSPTVFHALLFQFQNDETIDPRGFWDNVARES